MGIVAIYAFPGLAKRSPEFIGKVQTIAAKLETDPNWLLTIMQLESGIDPAARNPTGGATGLIQFMPYTAKRLGTSTDALREMSDCAQLDYVERFYQPYTGKLQGPGDVYMVTFYPAKAFLSPSTVIAKKGEKVYDQNAGLDFNRDGVLTVGDVESKAKTAYANYKKLGEYAAPKTPNAPISATTAYEGGLLVATALALGAGLWFIRRKSSGTVKRYR